MQNPENAFRAIKNKYLQLEVPYTHMILFSHLKYERGLALLCKTLGLPSFQTQSASGKDLHVEIKEEKRLVVTLAFEFQLDDCIQLYGRLLGAYLHFGKQCLRNANQTPTR